MDDVKLHEVVGRIEERLSRYFMTGLVLYKK